MNALSEHELGQLEQYLFRQKNEEIIHTYAVVEKLLDDSLEESLYQFINDAVPLYPETESDAIIDSGPHLVTLKRNQSLTNWLLQETYAQRWCLFLHSHLDLDTVARHLKTFTTAITPDSKECYFRFYDPIITDHWLTAVVDNGRADKCFGPILSFMCPGEEPWMLLTKFRDNNNPAQFVCQTLDLRDTRTSLPQYGQGHSRIIERDSWRLEINEMQELDVAAYRNYILKLRDNLLEYTLDETTNNPEIIKSELEGMMLLFSQNGIDEKQYVTQLVQLAYNQPRQWQEKAPALEQILSQVSMSPARRIKLCQDMVSAE